MMNLEAIKRVTINDFSEYEPEKGNNGGCYGFWTMYSRENLESDTWQKSYGTTADMEYCPVCGDFANHYDGDEDCYSCGDFETVTTQELKEIIASFEREHMDDDDYFVKYKVV